MENMKPILLCGLVLAAPRRPGSHQRSLCLLLVLEKQHWYFARSHSTVGRTCPMTFFLFPNDVSYVLGSIDLNWTSGNQSGWEWPLMWIGSKSSLSSHSCWQNGGRGKAKLQCHWLRQCSAMQFPAILLARAMLGCRPMQCVQCAVWQCADWIAFEAAVCKSSKQIHL